MAQRKNDVKNFWAEFEDAVIGSRIPESPAEWYVRTSIESLSGIRCDMTGEEELIPYRQKETCDSLPHCRQPWALLGFRIRRERRNRGSRQARTSRRGRCGLSPVWTCSAMGAEI